jgi:hypothetical protein
MDLAFAGKGAVRPTVCIDAPIRDVDATDETYILCKKCKNVRGVP